MNLLVLVLNKGRGSGEYVRQTYKRLVADGYTITIASTQRVEVEGCKSLVIPLERIPVHEYLPGAPNQKPVYSMNSTEVQVIIDEFLNSLRPLMGQVNLIHCHHANVTAIIGFLLAQEFAIPIVNTVHGTGLERLEKFDPAVRAKIKTSLAANDQIIVTSNFMKQMLTQKLPAYPPNRIITIPCGVDTAKYNPEAPKTLSDVFSSDEIANYNLSEPYVLYAGAMIEAKGPQDLVKALKSYQREIQTLFISGGPLVERIKKEVAVNKLNAKVLGFVSEEQKEVLFNNAYLTVFPILKDEHFGIVFIESFASGVPCITYTGGSAEEIVTADVGKTVAKGNIDELGVAVAHLLQNKEQREAMAKQARIRAETQYDYDTKIIPRFKELFRALVG
ncbi:MAG: glycosyltransferase family 4 protein [Candidatus Hodarchaeales archaeon]|jgi:glycosyltransferase involved in cell wall biosynthesis